MAILSKHDLKGWSDFTSSHAFESGMNLLRDNRSPVVNRGKAEEMIFDSGRVAGYAQALKDIRDLGIEQTPERDAAQPGLESPPSR